MHLPAGGDLVRTATGSLSATYHVQFALRLRGVLDVAALQRALRALVARHEALRTRFVLQDGVPWQVVDLAAESLPLPVTDLDADQIDGWPAEELRRPLNLATGPVFRAALARFSPYDHVLALVVHHIVADGWSVRILAGELSQLYTAEAAGTPAQLPDVPVQPADYAA